MIGPAKKRFIMKAHAGGGGQTFLLDSYNIFFRGWKQEDKGKDTHCSSLNVIAHIWGGGGSVYAAHPPTIEFTSTASSGSSSSAPHQNDELDVYNREKGQQLYSPLGLVYV